MIFEALMTVLLAYQIFMPNAQNGKYQIVSDTQGIVRMNTQDGTMVRCDTDLVCEEKEQ